MKGWKTESPRYSLRPGECQTLWGEWEQLHAFLGTKERPQIVWGLTLASFPGLHAQLLSLKAGHGGLGTRLGLLTLTQLQSYAINAC